MKQAEKLDLILRALYSIGSSTIEEICETQSIPINSHEEMQGLSERLRDEGYIKVTFTKENTFATITSHGIQSCEEELNFMKNTSISNNIFNINTNSNSPNTNIVLDSSNVTFTIQNYPEIESKMKEIYQAILDNNEISIAQQENLKTSLKIIETLIKSGKKAKLPFEELLSNVANIGTIAQLVIQLGKLI